MKICLQRVCRVEHGAADRLGAVLHCGQSEACTIGGAEEIPRFVAQRDTQVFEIGGILDTVIGAQIDALTLVF